MNPQVSEPSPFSVATLREIVIPSDRPSIIFLDAVGTLFGIRGTVGDLYGLLAARHGVTVTAETLNPAFYQSFQDSPPAAFPTAQPSEIRQCEYDWWRAIAWSTFHQVGVVEQFSDFDVFFADVFAYFATEEPWFLYPDVIPTLETWQTQGLQMAVLSNFDSRLYPVLKVLGLDQFFASVTISTEAGAAKPAPEIFHAALQKHACSPDDAWHIGDSRREDYQAATAVGIRGIWLNRENPLIPAHLA
jgi:putative hydrolase of the HAD superfamily